MQTILQTQPKKGTAEKYGVNFDKLIETIIGLLVFIMPVFFVPLTAEAVGFNKVYLAILVALVALLLLFIKGIKDKSFSMLNPKAYIGLLLLFSVAVLSVVFSRNRNISLFGYYGNYSASFMYLTAMIILAFVASNIKFSVRNLLTYFGLGVALSTLISFMPFYGFPIPFIGTAAREFTFSGSPNAFVGLQVVAVVSSLYLMGSQVTKGFKWKVIFGIIFAVNLTYLVGTLNWLALGIVLIALIYLVVTKRFNVKKNLDILIPSLGFVLVLSVFGLVPQTRSVLGIEAYNSPLRMPLRESWWVSANAMRDFPLLGTGVGTYFMDFSYYRPQSMNFTTFWQARFTNPFNDFFLWLSVAGLVGLAVYILFWLKVFKDVKDIDSDNDSNFALELVIVTGFSVIVLLGYNYILSLFLLVSYGVLLHRLYVRRKGFVVTQKYLPAFLAVLVVVLMVGYGFVAYRKYAGQYTFRQSVRAANLVDRYNLQKRALQYDPLESLYRRENILTGLIIARQLAQQENLAEQDVSVFQRVIQEAVLDSRRLTEIINPADVANWEIRGLTYNALIGLNQNAYPFAVQAYTNAISLEQTNPALWLTRGQVYYSRGEYLRAAQDFAQAVQLKNDYANAYYNLAFALRELKDYRNALVQMEIVQRLIPQDSSDRERLGTELDEFRKLAQEQQEQILQQQQAQLELLKQQQEQQAKNEDALRGKDNTSTEPLTEPTETQEEVQIEGDGIGVEDEVLNENNNVPEPGQEEQINVPVEEEAPQPDEGTE